MNIVLAIAIIVLATVLAITAMLLVRRRAPAGGFFNDGDRAAGVFGVLATGFAVLIGFVVFLAFASYDSARSGAEREARILGQQVETAQLLPRENREELIGELVCYGRSVAGVQWDRLQAGSVGDHLNPWASELYATLVEVEPDTPSEQAAYQTWLEERAEREDARNDRIHGATGVIPAPLWGVLFLSTALIITYMLFFADSDERVIVQAMLMGSVVATVVSLLVLLQFLDRPFHEGVGGLKPSAMERTLALIDEQLAITDFQVDPPCDERGNPVD